MSKKNMCSDSQWKKYSQVTFLHLKDLKGPVSLVLLKTLALQDSINKTWYTFSSSCCFFPFHFLLMPSNWEKKKQSKLHFLVSSELLVTGTDCFNIFAGQIENQNALSLQTQIAVKNYTHTERVFVSFRNASIKTK